MAMAAVTVPGKKDHFPRKFACDYRPVSSREDSDLDRPPPGGGTVEAWQVEVLGELRQIRQLLERQQRPVSALSRADRALLGRLLPAIAGALGSESFTSRDLAADSSPGLRLVLRGLSVKQIGRLLSRAEGIPLEGWVIERCGVEINVTLWRAVATVIR
jgi:hypothetical protein